MVEILEHLPVSLATEEIRKWLHVKNEDQWQEIEPLAQWAASITGKAVYKASCIEAKAGDSIVIDGISLTSKVLRKNVDKLETVFPYVVTIGDSVEEKAQSLDVLGQYYLTTIGNKAVSSARDRLIEHVRTRFASGDLGYMSPGSLRDWPIEEQVPLFSILGDVESSIGVRLTESLVMQPRMSVSGILFPTDSSFVNCRLCPRKQCPSRRARFDEALAREYGIEIQ